MPVSQWQWVTLAEGFPPSLVTNKPETELKPNETPNATGISATAEGYIAGGSIPSATTRIVKTYTIGSTAYEWHYSRLWAMDPSTPDLFIGAPRYTATFYKQNSGEINFNEDTNVLTKMLPIGETGLILFKTTGAYIIPNANDLGGGFIRGDFIQEAALASADYAIELNGTVYFCANSTMYSIGIQGNVEEVGLDLRGSITAAALTANYTNKQIIVGSAKVYDTVYKRWLAYSGTTFVYETRRIKASDQSTPMAIRAVGFDYTWVSGTSEGYQGTISFQTQEEDRQWSDTTDVTVTNDTGKHVRLHTAIAPHNCRDFKLKVTALDPQLKLKRVSIEVTGYTEESRDT